jgi:hypothetical protein
VPRCDETADLGHIRHCSYFRFLARFAETTLVVGLRKTLTHPTIQMFSWAFCLLSARDEIPTIRESAPSKLFFCQSSATGAAVWSPLLLTSTPSNGGLLIGNGSGFTVATLTGTVNQVNVTNGAGSVTLSLPQPIAPSNGPQFAQLGIGTPAVGTSGILVGNTIADSGTVRAIYLAPIFGPSVTQQKLITAIAVAANSRG